MKTVALYALDPQFRQAGPYWAVYPEGETQPIFVRAKIHPEAVRVHDEVTLTPDLRPGEHFLGTVEIP